MSLPVVFCFHNYEWHMSVWLKRRRSVRPFPQPVVHKCFMWNMYFQWSRKGLWVSSIQESHHQNTQPTCLRQALRVILQKKIKKPKKQTNEKKQQQKNPKTSGGMLFYSVASVGQLHLFLTPPQLYYYSRWGKSLLQHKQGQILPVWKPIQTIVSTSATSPIRGKLTQTLVPGF